MHSLKTVVWSWVALALLASGCSSTEVSFYPRPDPGPVEDTSGGSDAAAADGVDGEDGPKAWAGAPCAEDGDCTPGICVNEDYLAILGVTGLEIPNGMCSKLACAKDEDCGPNGFCFDTEPFTQNKISICLERCSDLSGCRWSEAYTCHKIEEGDETGACLPASISVAVICDTECEEQP